MDQLPAQNNNIVQLEKQLFGESENNNQILEFEKIFKLIRRYKYFLVLFAVLGGLTGYFYANSQIPLYRAEVNIVVEPESSNRSEFLNNSLRYYIPTSFYETQMVVLTSKIILERAAATLSPTIVQKLFVKSDENWFGNYYKDLQKRIRGWLNLLGLGQLMPKPTDTDEEILGYTIPVIAEQLSRQVEVDFGSTSQLILLEFVSSNPLISAVTANIIADSYISYLVENRISQTERAGKWLAERIEESRQKLSQAENELKEFQLNEQLFDLTTVKSLSSSTLATVNNALLLAQQNYAELSKKYGPKHPDLIEAKKKLTSAQSHYGAASKKDLSANENKFELTKLERAVNSNRELYELFLSRFNEVELGIDSVSSNTKILERASIPVAPFSPDIESITTRSALLGLIIGILFVIGKELLDRTFKNQMEIEERLQLPVLGVLPLLTNQKFRKKAERIFPERYYFDHSKSNFSEVVNHVRTGIIYSNVDNPPKVILVTSALPKEGKTTCASNLSLAFSKIGKTLLIDADFRKPRIAKISNVENVNGLTGYVAAQNSLQECLSQDPDSPNLYIMKSGEVPPNPLELLSSDRFKEVLTLMKKHFDYIIIDSAPIIPVSDGVVLGKLADSIVLVVQANSTTYQISETAIRRFRSANLNPTGVILSQVDYQSSSYYYGKYEYYSREYYG